MPYHDIPRFDISRTVGYYVCFICLVMFLTHNSIQSLFTEKDKTKEKYLSLFEENAHLLSEKQENERIISTLRNDLAQLKNHHQLIVDQLKSEHTKEVEKKRKLEVINEKLYEELNYTKFGLVKLGMASIVMFILISFR